MDLNNILGADGLLSQAISGFTPREAQFRMAEAVEKALTLDSQLIVEAGTGTGKTFAYLIPIFLSQKKTIISTGTKNLQDQLFFKDIPILRKILSFSQAIVLLKGRANYLCKYRLQQSLTDGRFISRQLVAELQEVHAWASLTQTGDISELNTLPEDSSVWPYVTSTTDNCLGQDCAFYKECFLVKVRQQALAATVVIVNHHLFFADMALQEENVGELLPGAEVIVFDEAHQLAEVASQFFSTSLTGRQLIELARDVEVEIIKSAKDMREVIECADQLQAATHDVRLALGSTVRRAAWPVELSLPLAASLENLNKSLDLLETHLKIAAARSKGLEACWVRVQELRLRLAFLTRDVPPENVRWFETYTQSFALQLTPLTIADIFKKYREGKKRSWIFTSATLSVKNNFQLLIESLGLQGADQLQLNSPFDYQKQSMLYVPRGLPDPRAADYIEKLIEAAIPVLKLMQGKTFLLFTSYKAMEQAALLLKDRVPYPLLLQGSLPKKELIDQFTAHGQAILLGTSSFWYGVDVRGDALSCVIIDKLPFAAPEDPILKARIQLMKKNGLDPFQHYQLPQAVLMLKQGAGRLIRDSRDRGVLMICDPRLVGAKYGEVFLQSLPGMSRTRDFAKVAEFFQEKNHNEIACH